MLAIDESITEKLKKASSIGKRYALIGFSGWPDAGKVASLTVAHFIKSLKAEKILEFSELYDLTLNRPSVEVEEGLIRRLSFLEATVYLWVDPEQNAALLIYSGPEPSYRWREFTDVILKLCSLMSIQRIYLVGGVVDMVTHTRKPRLSAVVNMEHLKAYAIAYGLSLTNYSGPASIHSYLMIKARERGFEALGVWGHVPSYVSYPNTIVAYHMALKLSEMMNLTIDLEELRKMAEELRMKLDRMVEESADLKRMIEQIERRYGEFGGPSYIA